MSIKFKNNANSTLDSGIGTSDLGITVAAGEGSLFPALGVGDYFYLTLIGADGEYEIVKVTARSGDDMTIVRGQENTGTFTFPEGSLCELRITAQGLEDLSEVEDGALTIEKLEDIATKRALGRNTSGSGPVEEVSTSQMLDWIEDTHGSILFRRGNLWSGLEPGGSGDVLTCGGPAANPSWQSGTLVTDGDKGDITVSSSGADWDLNAGAVTLSKMENRARYDLIGRSSSGSGPPEAVPTSSAVYTLLGSASQAALRTNLGLGTIATQAASSVAITGGTATGLTSLGGTMQTGVHTSGTLTSADANSYIPMSGNITLDGGVFSAPQAFLFYSGASSRTLTEGTSMTLRLGGTATTGNRTLAARTLAVGVVIGTNEIVISGNGVS